MARGGRSTAGGPSSPLANIELIRRRIDRLDRRIVDLLNERARLGIAAGRAKVAAGQTEVRDLAREREVLRRVGELNGGPIPRDDLVRLYEDLMAITRRLEVGGRPGTSEPNRPREGV